MVNSSLKNVHLITVFVGYEYTSCKRTIWTTQSTTLRGYDMDISELGGWNLDIHHRYNFQEGNLAPNICLAFELCLLPSDVDTYESVSAISSIYVLVFCDLSMILLCDRYWTIRS